MTRWEICKEIEKALEGKDGALLRVFKELEGRLGVGEAAETVLTDSIIIRRGVA